MPTTSDNPNTQRWHAWLNRHAADRTRIGPMTMLRSIVASVDRERAHAGVTRTAYVAAALLAMESLTPGERQRFLQRYAELVGA
ncbi:hypothetical protein C7401_102303 [Paraburkholderia unamae]|uniref:hypothetical protein n=1 Tax=Paraburkholderia unamae TaxID=219649 RepID=UPI000DC29BD8|nr:hypothetical protein [Paraburkholderia unamae]RAR66878.1 hypothetical protein C7401_102303 [Paraburkholderia unamae]